MKIQKYLMNIKSSLGPLSSNISRYNSFRKLGKLRQEWIPVVGLEIHVQLKCYSKLFSGSSSIFGAPANTNVSLFDAAIPGTLPVLNRRCVELGVTTALALSCHVNQVSSFDRKHYFYADLPAGYQITQQRVPLASNGQLKFPVFQPGIHKKPYQKVSKILKIQLEQDSGKSLHDDIYKRSLIDLNRAGVPLIEVVFAPDLCDGYEAAAVVKELILILKTLDICTCKMEEGALRVDANVSVHKEGESLGIRTEVKNIGSIRGVAHAVNYEINRQIDVLHTGGKIFNETRAWDALSDKTLPMRDKEIKQDYRFMPEPNLPPLRLNTSEHISETMINVKELKSSLPKLPEESREELKNTYKLSPETILHLVSDEELLSLFNKILVVKSRDAKTVASLLTVELLSLINQNLTYFNDGKFDKTVLGSIVDLLQSGDINLNVAKHVMKEIACGNPNTPEEIVTGAGLWQIKDTDELRRICKNVIKNNPDIVNQYKNGKTKVFSALLGIVASETNKKAKMDVVAKLFKELLKDQVIMKKILQNISSYEAYSVVENIFQERVLKVPTLRINQLLQYSDSSKGGCSEDNQVFVECPKKKKKPKPCPIKPCKHLPKYACDLPKHPDHCPYIPPKCVKPCIPKEKE